MDAATITLIALCASGVVHYLIHQVEKKLIRMLPASDARDPAARLKFVAEFVCARKLCKALAYINYALAFIIFKGEITGIPLKLFTTFTFNQEILIYLMTIFALLAIVLAAPIFQRFIFESNEATA